MYAGARFFGQMCQFSKTYWLCMRRLMVSVSIGGSITTYAKIMQQNMHLSNRPDRHEYYLCGTILCMAPKIVSLVAWPITLPIVLYDLCVEDIHITPNKYSAG